MATAGLTVAVTGPTGDLGVAIVDALERSRAVGRVVGMARRPFDPPAHGWRKTEYRQGDVTDATSVSELVAGADVVVHLAFAILSASDATRELNVEARAASSRRLPGPGPSGSVTRRASPPTDSTPTTRTGWTRRSCPAAHPRTRTAAKRTSSRCSARCTPPAARTAAYVFRPCIVAGRGRARCSRLFRTTASARRFPTRSSSCSAPPRFCVP